MPKTRILYGKKYRKCPCAQVNEHDTLNNTYYGVVCHSPKRERPFSMDGQDSGQQRLCVGGVWNGKRYTSCPYYTRTVNKHVPKGRKTNSWRKVLERVIGWIVCWIIASSYFDSNLEYGGLFGLVFFVLGIMSIVSLFKKSGKIDPGKKRRKRN